MVALNAKRAAKEVAGTVRWLRPEFQLRQRGGEQTRMDVGAPEADATDALALADLEARYTARVAGASGCPPSSTP